MLLPKPRRRRTGPLCAFVLLIGGRVDAAPSDPAGFDEERARTLASQPAGLSMELRLPKTRFYQGEIIPATLVFRNDSAQKYHTWIGTYDRSGRIPDLSFEAVGQDSQPVVDTLQPYLSMMGGGLGNEADLGTWEITLPANQWVRFDHPGFYRLVARSQRVVPGSKEDVRAEGVPAPQVIPLVSQIIDVQIDPLTSAQEQEILVRARADFASGSEEAQRRAAERLRYLQTPAARETLLPFVGRPDMFDAYFALAGAPDPAAEADRLLEAVAAGRVALSANLLVHYPQLKEGRAPFMITPPPRNGQPQAPIPDAGVTRLLTAAKASLRVQTWTEVSYQTLLALIQNDPRDPEMLALLVERQMNLPPDIGDKLLAGLAGDEFFAGGLRDADARLFLPLIHRAVNPPACDASALKLLARLAPAEARPLIVEDIRRVPFRYIPRRGKNVYPQVDVKALLSLPDGTLLPELDDALRRRLEHPTPQGEDSCESIGVTMKLVARYGSPALLPDVLRVYLPDEGHWYCAIQADILRFWMRCDPAGAARGLEIALHARADTACYENVLTEVLRDAWHDEALPVVLAALDDPEEAVWFSAAGVLGLHAAGPEVAEKMVSTAERIGAQPLSDRASDHDTSVYRQDRLVTLLLEGKEWELTGPQLKRLLALPNNRRNTREQIERRLAGGAR